MKKLLSITFLLVISVAASAQEPAETYDLQKISREIYRDYHYRIKNVVDSVLYHSDIDSLDCVVFDNLRISADGTTVHNVVSNSGNEKVNGMIEESLALLKLPVIMARNESGGTSPIDVSASYSIVSNARNVEYEFTMNVNNGEVQWVESVPDVLRGALDSFARTAFYSADTGKFRLKFSTFNINSEILAFGTFNVYRTKKKSEDIFIGYEGHQFSYFGKPFERESGSGEDFTNATFDGRGPNAFPRWVTTKLVYPQYAYGLNIMGTVDMAFTIDKDGAVRNVKVVHPVHPSLDREAFRVISASPDWEPGTRDGKAISITYGHPVIFVIKESPSNPDVHQSSRRSR